MRSHNRLALGSLILALVATIGACASWAADPPSKGKIAAPQQWTPPAYTPRIDSPPEPQSWQAHNWYLGLVGGYAWTPSVDDCGPACDDVWHGGVVGGYLWRNAYIGAGIEADYIVRDLGDFTLDDGVASLRARMGVFAGATFLYATAGVAEAIGDVVPGEFSRGLVVGGGVEREVAKGLALRLEALHYRHADDYFEWGDHGSTAVRGGVVVKF